MRLLTLTLFPAALALVSPCVAHACGCFARPNPVQPIVQAGERIVFAHDNGMVQAHIQVQYEGSAEDFGWLIPMPSVPTVSLSREELFTALYMATDPQFRLNRTVEACKPSFWDSFGFDGELQCSQSTELAVQPDGVQVCSPANFVAIDPTSDYSPVVYEDLVGPLEIAVLEAGDRVELEAWLEEHEYFVPTDGAVLEPYIREGSYFLALKLEKDSVVGDLQPIYLEYEADYPMIPIVLTSVGAVDDMGIQVWVLGEGRAIPRNYRHVVLNEEHINWTTSGANYAEVVGRAVDEAEGHHAFVTDFAGPTEPLVGMLDPPGRFGDEGQLAAISDPIEFVDMVLFDRTFLPTPELSRILGRHLPVPEALLELDPSFDQSTWESNLPLGLLTFRDEDREAYARYSETFDSVAAARLLFERIVEPMLRAGALFRNEPFITRLFTLLSPGEMTRDPVFAWNLELATVPRLREATLEIPCDSERPSILLLSDGRRLEVERAGTRVASPGVPFSTRIEMLREEGPPVVEVDNRSRLTPTIAEGGGGCGSTGVPSWCWMVLLSVVIGCRRLTSGRR